MQKLLSKMRQAIDDYNLIEDGDVLVNYNVEKSKNKIVSIGSIITIRKKGKFILEKNLGENKKGKFKILIKQYI